MPSTKMLRIDKLLADLRSAHARKPRTISQLAKEAGLHKNTLKDIDSDNWSPSIATIRALEPVLFATD